MPPARMPPTREIIAYAMPSVSSDGLAASITQVGYLCPGPEGARLVAVRAVFYGPLGLIAWTVLGVGLIALIVLLLVS